MGSPTKFTNEGGEQGDPLMPLLFALGQHNLWWKSPSSVEGK